MARNAGIDRSVSRRGICMHLFPRNADVELGRTGGMYAVPDWLGLRGILVCAPHELLLS